MFTLAIGIFASVSLCCALLAEASTLSVHRMSLIAFWTFMLPLAVISGLTPCTSTMVCETVAVGNPCVVTVALCIFCATGRSYQCLAECFQLQVLTYRVERVWTELTCSPVFFVIPSPVSLHLHELLEVLAEQREERELEGVVDVPAGRPGATRRASQARLASARTNGRRRQRRRTSRCSVSIVFSWKTFERRPL